MAENRAGAANLVETQGFIDDAKRILIFSDAGGTGRSYHAELSARNTRLRVHYLLEPGWKADAAIQGLGRTHRTNQAQPPLFRPIATGVKAEKRCLIDTMRERLTAYGLFHEIISWKLRTFVPTDATGPQCWNACWAAIRSSASANARRRDGPARRFRTGAAFRPGGRGGLPPLSRRRPSPGQLLAGR